MFLRCQTHGWFQETTAQSEIEFARSNGQLDRLPKLIKLISAPFPHSLTSTLHNTTQLLQLFLHKTHTYTLFVAN